ncbi:MAG: exonuclease SbcCD subunit D [Muribaculaceae bacterium]|nr:exonuclease SbcCD subunit D [Muribaculaceae bacterium]
MKILHTSDLHIGQIIYQYYERADEHLHFFSQLEEMVKANQPDLLIVAGDVFDIPQPSAAYWKLFTDAFVRIRNIRPEMAVVIVAGNHDSPSRLQSNSSIWQLANTKIVGTPPPLDFRNTQGWEEDFILRLPSGYVITLPFMNSEKMDPVIALQEYVAKENKNNLPVVMTGHLAVTGSDMTGHDFDIGTLRTTDISRFGSNYDYLALGHIHRPQTIGDPEDTHGDVSIYRAPVARYSGSAVHVSCDERYPHSVSLVEIADHKGEVKIKTLPISQLRHFVILPKEGDPFDNQKQILKFLKKWVKDNRGYYIRLRVKTGTDLSSDFSNNVYSLIENEGYDLRYNPKIIWEAEDNSGQEEKDDKENNRMEFEVEEIQQISDPLQFIRMTADRFPAIDLASLEDTFLEISKELKAMDEESDNKAKTRKSK